MKFLIVGNLFCFELGTFNLWNCGKLNDKLSSKSNSFAFCFDRASHLFNYVFANTETKSCSLVVNSVGVFQFAEIMKELTKVFFLNSDSQVSNCHFKRNIEVFKFVNVWILNLQFLILALPWNILIKVIVIDWFYFDWNLSFLLRKFKSIW